MSGVTVVIGPEVVNVKFIRVAFMAITFLLRGSRGSMESRDILAHV